MKPLRQLVCTTLAFIFTVTNTPFAMASSVANRNRVYNQAYGGDSTWKQFANGPWRAPQMGPFDRNDPVLDQNPYFLRSEKWYRASANTTKDVKAYRSDKGLNIQYPGSRYVLGITEDFAPLYESDDFLFLQSRSTAIFEQRARNASEYAEGLFFIDKSMLAKEALRANGTPRPVPVYFLPTTGTGWTQKVLATQVVESDVIAFQNAAGGSDSFEVSDIQLLAKQFRNNLIFTSIAVLKNNLNYLKTHLKVSDLSNPAQLDLPFVYPAKGSTAAFGLFMTGLDLDHPERSQQAVAYEKGFWDFLLPQAHADSLLTPDVVDKLIIVGQITGTVFVTSVLAKYTVLKQRILERRKDIEDKADEAATRRNLPATDRSSTTYKVKREAKEWVDVFSHGLATLSGAISTVSGFLLEYGADNLWRPDAKVNKLARRFLEYTFLYNRKQNEYIAANWQTFFLGVVILGGIDTAGVVLQLLFVSPIFFPWVAQAFGDKMHERITDQFSGQDAAANNIVTSEIMRNLSAYFVSGAYSYSSQQRQKIMEDTKADVEKRMMRRGKNPYDPRNQSELEKVTEEVIEKMLVERGLPSRSEFLFSAPSTVRSLAHLMGYKVDRTKIIGEDSFLLEKARWGLITHSLKRAIKTLEDLQKMSRDPAIPRAIAFLKKLKSDYGVISATAKRPWAVGKNLSQAKDARRILTLLSYEGDTVGGAVKYLDHIPGYAQDPEAISLGARLYRQSLFSLVENKPFILQPNADQMRRYYNEALEEAQRTITNEVDAKDKSTMDVNILALEIVKQKIEENLQREAVTNWRPEKQDWLERKQVARAHSYALSKVAEAEVAEPGHIQLADSNREIYKAAYADKLADIVGLRAESAQDSELVKAAMDAAASETKSSLESNPGMKQFFDNLNPEEQVRFSAHLYAKNYLDKYMQMTVSNSSIISLTSPEQPGRFQKLRQTKLVQSKNRLGRSLNVALRALESPMDNGAFKPGVGSWIRRNIPWAGDWKATGEIKLRTIATAMTVGYLGNYYLWQVHFPWDTYLFFFATGGFTMVVSYWLDRIMINMGVRPMDTMKDKVKYSLLYTWLTYPSYIPFFFFLEDYEWFSGKVRDAVSGAGSTVIEQGISICQKLLGVG